jgi:beta-xylosidase
MRMHCGIWVLAIVGFMASLASAQGDARSPWVPDLGDGTFKNPIIYADYSDPDVIRVGDDFYMTASSFGCVPGLPILHSKDLINWKIIGHAIQRLPERFDTPQPRNGIWAPSIRFHDGYFWIFVGDPDWGILMTKAKDPAGPWSELHVVQEGKGLIDCCPLWDDDGKAYLAHAFANSRAGRNSIIVAREMSPDGTKLIGDEHLLIDGRNNVLLTLEGAKFYKRNGWYYVMAPAGGVTNGYQIAARSRTPLGTYEVKKVLERGSTNINGPHQGGWVETQSGEGWFMHFQDRGAYGRITHLQPLRWVDDWPVIGLDFDKNGVGEPVWASQKPNVGANFPKEEPQTSDDFNDPKLGLQWQWAANPKPEWLTLDARKGWLRLNAVPKPQSDLTAAANQLLQKLPAPSFKATTKVELNPGVNTSAGVIVSGSNYSALLVSQDGDGVQIRRVTFGADAPPTEQVEASVNGLKGAVWLRVGVEPEAVCNFSYSADGVNFTPLGRAFTARTGGWIGCKVGLICLGESGSADFDFFRIEP